MKYTIDTKFNDFPVTSGHYYVHITEHDTYNGMVFQFSDLKSTILNDNEKDNASFSFTYNIIDNNGIMFDETDEGVKDCVNTVMKDFLMNGMRLIEKAIEDIKRDNKTPLTDKEFYNELCNKLESSYSVILK